MFGNQINYFVKFKNVHRFSGLIEFYLIVSYCRLDPTIHHKLISAHLKNVYGMILKCEFTIKIKKVADLKFDNF